MEGGQGGCRGQEAGGVAAGISHPTGLSDDALWVLVQLREAIDPAGGGTVGGGGIDDPGVPVLNEPHRLPGGGIGQAEKHQVGRVEVFFSAPPGRLRLASPMRSSSRSVRRESRSQS